MKPLLILAIVLMSSSFANAQADPVKWSSAQKKVDDKTFEVHLTATIAAPWHIYSGTTPEGGPVPTSVQFSKNPMIIMDGEVKEVGKLLQKHEEVFGVDVKYYEGKLELVQVVRLKSKIKTSVSGSIRFMVCNDRECLAPKVVPFSVSL